MSYSAACVKNTMPFREIPGMPGADVYKPLSTLDVNLACNIYDEA